MCRTTDTIDFQPPPPPPPPPPQVSQINTQVVPFGWSQTIKLTLPSYTGYHQFGGGGGSNSTNTTTTTKAMSCNKIGQSIEHANRLRKSTWQTKENSVNSAFGEGTRRCFSFVNSNGPTQTGRRRSTLNPDGGWTISTWSVSLPTILGGRDLYIWLPSKSWYKNCTLASIPKPLKFLRPHYPLLKVMYELAGTIAKSTTHNQG